MDFNANELHFIKQAVENANIKGKDTIFVAEVLIKTAKALEMQAKAEGLIPETGDQAAPPVSPLTGEPMEAVSMPDMQIEPTKKKTGSKKA